MKTTKVTTSCAGKDRIFSSHLNSTSPCLPGARQVHFVPVDWVGMGQGTR